MEKHVHRQNTHGLQESSAIKGMRKVAREKVWKIQRFLASYLATSIAFGESMKKHFLKVHEGKKCDKCGSTKRYIKSGDCVPCRAMRAANRTVDQEHVRKRHAIEEHQHKLREGLIEL